MRSKFIVIFCILTFSSIFLALWMFTLAGVAEQYPVSAPKQKSNLITDSLNVYIPILVNNYCISETVESPFSIEIASIFEITATATSVMDQKTSEAQYNEWYTQAFPTLISALKESGAGYTRVYIRWRDIEPNEPIIGQPPVYDLAFLKWYDDRLVQFAQNGIKVIATIGAAPAWANDNNYGSTGPCLVPPVTADHQQDYQRFVTDLVTHYDQPPYNIDHWEIFNEADNTTMERKDSHACFGNSSADYAHILAMSTTVIKSIDPTATVLMSGIAYDWFLEYQGPFYRYFPDDVMKELERTGQLSNFDALNFHYFPDFHLEWERWNPPALPPTCGNVEDGLGTPYDGSGIDLIAKKNHFTNRMNTCFGVSKPVWLTELAGHGVTTDTESLRYQAYYVIQGYTRGLAAGIQNITWYALATLDPYGQSLLTSDLSPKPAYYTYRILTAQLKDYKFNRTLNVPGAEAYVFTNNCEGEKIVAWGSNVPLTISPATSIKVVDYLGNITIIQDGGPGDMDGVKNGSVKITLNLDPMGSIVVPNPVPIPVFVSVISK